MSLSAPLFVGRRGSAHVEDAIQFLHGIGGQADLQIHDIPYEVSKPDAITRTSRKGKSADLQRNFGVWDRMPNLTNLAEGCDRAAKPNANVCVFFNNWYHVSDLVRLLNQWFDQVHVLTWIKSNPAPQVRRRHFLAGTEMIVWASRGDYPMEFISQAEMRSWVQSGICQGHERIKGADGRALHRSQKPSAVVDWLIQRLSLPGQLVVDAYAGVLTTAHSATALNRRYLVNDLNLDYVTAGVARLRDLESSVDADLVVQPSGAGDRSG